ncbi:MAG: HIT family protein [Defluviitaleaceae bacterium]|nr:HIT family protein [Defluviitaleaceae bacterium]
MRNDCVFCAIADGELPSNIIYEDDLFVVIPDRNPKCAGHALIFPRKHAATIYELPDLEASRLFPCAKKIAAAIGRAFPSDGLNLIQNNGAAAGQTVGHLHLHLIPRQASDGMKIKWEPTDPGLGELASAANKIRAALNTNSGD